VRIIYADVDYYNHGPLFNVVELRDQDGIDLMRFVDKKKCYSSTAEVLADLEDKLHTDRIKIEITPD
jgi:hypothetical protein